MVESVARMKIAIDHFAFEEGQAPVIRNLHFRLRKGSFTCIVGPSGCGKTTLLNLICGLEKPRTPQCHVAITPPARVAPIGKAPIGKGPTEKGKQTPHHIGYMFQTPRLMPWLNGLDNVLLATGKTWRQKRDFAITLLSQVGLDGKWDLFPRQLSGGMQRRVALARAFVNAPSLLLLDEPFTSLDEPLAYSLRDLLLDRWRQAKATIIFVTHDLNEALFLADRILFLRPSPTRITLDYGVPLKRGKARNPAAIAAIKEKLMAQNPSLLKGVGGDAPPFEIRIKRK